jgi:hypothetical protein
MIGRRMKMISRLSVFGEFYFKEMFIEEGGFTAISIAFLPLGALYVVMLFIPVFYFLKYGVSFEVVKTTLFLMFLCFKCYLFIVVLYASIGWVMMKFGPKRERELIKSFTIFFVKKKRKGLFRMGVFYFVVFILVRSYIKGKYSKQQIFGMLEYMAEFLYLGE